MRAFNIWHSPKPVAGLADHGRLSSHDKERNTLNKISVVIPVKEEMKLQFHHKIIDSYQSFPNCELLWVLGPNNDGTCRDLLNRNQRVLLTNSNSRAERINIGIRETQNDLVLLNHPRSFLSHEAISTLSEIECRGGNTWGGFTHEFYQSNHFALKFTSFYSNRIRFGMTGIIYLDHCIFFTRDIISAQDPAPVPMVDIFEDTLFSEKLRKKVAPLRIREKSFTSPVRFISNGIFRQSLMNQKLKLKHKLGFSATKMNRDYEKDLNLNSEY